ncbi:ornithine carbamoyltransferase [Nonomuraea insulae]|uniref:Ornithine carbamoyltransferase n=1 Tax=Nonomuraea insulae TaxID=1616787 RepID=A0ABW1D660_9ACTN
MARTLLSLSNMEPKEVAALVDRAVELARTPRTPQVLAGRAIGIYFATSSTRTRTAFWRAATALGADVISYGPEDLQLVTGESLADTARVLAAYLDAIVVRTNGEIREMAELADAADLPVVNALSSHEHPTQALADLTMLRAEFGTVAGRHVLYVGEGNSTAMSLAHAVALSPGLRLTLITPEGYGIPDGLPAWLREHGAQDRVQHGHDLDAVIGPVDAIYTSRWNQMGVPKADPQWRSHFLPYQVTDALFARIGGERSIFLHDLPAVRGDETTAEVIDGPRSRVFRQAFYKYAAAMAILEWCVCR